MTDQQRPEQPSERSDDTGDPTRDTQPLPERDQSTSSEATHPEPTQPEPTQPQPTQPEPTQPLPTESGPPQYQAYPAEAAAAESHQPAFAPPPLGPEGKVRATGTCILLYIVTLGFYSLYWFFAVHQEMKRHSGRGIGGGIALVIALFLGFVIPFLTSNEAGDLYSARGEKPRVTGLTGLWYVPGFLILIGPIVWFVKTNGALNEYWERAAQAPEQRPGATA